MKPLNIHDDVPSSVILRLMNVSLTVDVMSRFFPFRRQRRMTARP